MTTPIMNTKLTPLSVSDNPHSWVALQNRMMRVITDSDTIPEVYKQAMCDAVISKVASLRDELARIELTARRTEAYGLDNKE
jgi:hypothetical protein